MVQTVRRLSPVVLGLAFAAIYIAAARLGLTMAFVAAQVSPVWPPTGIAIAAVLLLGYRVWPGIWLGAFVANVGAHEPLGTAVGIAVGNTLEALAAAWLLHRALDFHAALNRLRDVLGFIGLAALAATTVSATVGVTSLCLGGVQSWSHYPQLWWIWWLGDAIGALVVTPVLLAYAGASTTLEMSTRGNRTTLAPSVPAASDRPAFGLLRLSRARKNVTDVDDTTPPSAPAIA